MIESRDMLEVPGDIGEEIKLWPSKTRQHSIKSEVSIIDEGWSATNFRPLRNVGSPCDFGLLNKPREAA